MSFLDKIKARHEAQGYTPKFLSWATSYEDEVREFRELISGNPADVKLLKQEYESLTGKKYKRSRNE